MRVLIVEDQPDRLAMLVPALEAAGCVVMATLNSSRSLDAQIQALHDQLEQTRLELSERKLIDQAKAHLIKQTGATESEVYREMRKTAMDRGMKLADIARQVLQRPLA